MTDTTTLSFTDIEAAELEDWRWLVGKLYAHYATGDFATGLSLVAAVGDLAEAANHHPDVELQYPHLRITLVSHDAAGVTSRDVDLARQISQRARELGISADPTRLSVFEVALDTADDAAIRPFWAAVLGVEETGDGDVPPLWFQETEPHEEPRQRFHVDVTVPHEVAEARIAAALAAGGTLVSDEFAPSFTVLADAQGNKACIATPS